MPGRSPKEPLIGRMGVRRGCPPLCYQFLGSPDGSLLYVSHGALPVWTRVTFLGLSHLDSQALWRSISWVVYLC